MPYIECLGCLKYFWWVGKQPSGKEKYLRRAPEEELADTEDGKFLRKAPVFFLGAFKNEVFVCEE